METQYVLTTGSLLGTINTQKNESIHIIYWRYSMDTLLIFFALPIAVIIISAILEKLLKCPIAVASLIFAIFLVVTFAVFDEFDSALPYIESLAAIKTYLEAGTGIIVITHDPVFASLLPGRRVYVKDGVLHEY